MAPQGILETCLYADDLDRAERFYSRVLGLELVDRARDRHVFFRCGDQMLLIFRPSLSNQRQPMGTVAPPPHGATGPGHVCFRAFDHEIPRWIERLTAAGVRIEADFTWPTGGRSIYFRDPAGNSLEFAEPRIWSNRS
ncbi:MAG: VOC family protein [Paracoccaceae bacterium]